STRTRSAAARPRRSRPAPCSPGSPRAAPAAGPAGAPRTPTGPPARPVRCSSSGRPRTARGRSAGPASPCRQHSGAPCRNLAPRPSAVPAVPRRALLLRFLAHHVDQVDRVELDIDPTETPELWHTDLATTTEARVSFPTAPAPMARVLSLDALTGMPAGPGRAVVEIVDDTFIGGRYELEGSGGALHIARAPDRSTGMTLTVPGLSGLVYGVLNPGDIVVRGLGAVPTDAAGELSLLFPRLTPYFCTHF